MADLLTTADKNAIGDAFDDMHDTFARTITIYQRKNSVFIATNSTYNALYKRIKAAPNTKSKVTTTSVQARILYAQKQIEQELSSMSSQIDVPVSKGLVRIKIPKAGYDVIEKATTIQMDGFPFQIISTPAPIGPFNPKYYTLYLERSD